jgi:hypothetical protein
VTFFRHLKIPWFHQTDLTNFLIQQASLGRGGGTITVSAGNSIPIEIFGLGKKSEVARPNVQVATTEETDPVFVHDFPITVDAQDEPIANIDDGLDGVVLSATLPYTVSERISFVPVLGGGDSSSEDSSDLSNQGIDTEIQRRSPVDDPDSGNGGIVLDLLVVSDIPDLPDMPGMPAIPGFPTSP